MPTIGIESAVIPIERDRQIDANLHVPERATGLVVFAHGSGSSRRSSRNRAVAEFLHGRGLGTLLLDLLTREEEAVDVRTREYRFDIDGSPRASSLPLTGLESGTICSGFRSDTSTPARAPRPRSLPPPSVPPS